ncbi:hypothetical protein RRG08_066942 [Elysia crispata]|uniref:Uncharacterized protein n=1 Tax=Elysia crispata TaxID=231223 RepID=A0AAE1AQ29_9GAST|nr:hypothetical protein RRG08_066942 [Elysia crispata]
MSVKYLEIRRSFFLSQCGLVYKAMMFTESGIIMIMTLMINWNNDDDGEGVDYNDDDDEDDDDDFDDDFDGVDSIHPAVDKA